ncbi:MAG: glycogen debranching N-terminal domain-containing protein [Gemmatimonadota bacterium]
MADHTHRADGAPNTVPAVDLLGYETIRCEQRAQPLRQLVLKEGALFLLTDAAGNVTPPGECELGLFHEDTRYLSHYDLSVAGTRPDVLGSQAARVYASQIDLTVVDRQVEETFTEPKNFLHIRRGQLLGRSMLDRLAMTNFMGRPVEIDVELRFAADYADIFEVRGADRPGRGRYFEPEPRDGEVLWTYEGLDGRVRRTLIRFSRRPGELRANRARWRFRLEPKGVTEFEIEIVPSQDDARPTVSGAAFDARFSRLHEDGEAWRASTTKLRTDDAFFNTALRQAITDLHALRTPVRGRTVLTAGIPWFTAPFGRDALITGLETLVVAPELSRGALRFLAAHQGRRTDDWTEEEPGKIMHELRRGEMAACAEVPHVPYYGSVDATPLFILLLGETYRWTGDASLLDELMPHAERALAWIDEYGDLDGDGFVEYQRRSVSGLTNQGWKDSHDGVPFPDGSLPESPIALVEVQGYVYAAKRVMADLLQERGDDERAAVLRAKADALRERIRDAFWMEDAGYFALALDGEKRAVPTITSNAGHLLWTGVPTREQASRMVDVLLGPTMFSGWGVRTLARQQAVYNPLAYHNGTIWPHDNAIVGWGLARYGFRHAAARILTALFEASLHFRYHRLPELFCGIWRGATDTPVEYPVSCSPQAWAAGAFFPLIQGLLGIEPAAQRGALRLDRPLLPRPFRFLDVLDMRVGRSRVSLAFNRRGERTMANVTGAEGESLHVRIDIV